MGVALAIPRSSDVSRYPGSQGLPSFKTQKKNNRERILEITNKTEDDIKKGLSVSEMMPFFEQFSIPLRVYDCMGERLHRYDPEKKKSPLQGYVLHGEKTTTSI